MLAQVGNIKSNTMDEVQLQDVIMDIVTGAIRSTDISLDLYRWSEFPTFTKSQKPTTTSPLDSYMNTMVLTTIIKRPSLDKVKQCNKECNFKNNPCPTRAIG